MLDECEHEHRRLLYVAMTRAAERLIVCGCHGKTRPKDGCWYNLIFSGLRGQPGFAEVTDGDTKMWRYRQTAEGLPPLLPGEERNRPAPISVPRADLPAGGGEPPASPGTEADLPSWLTTPVPATARAAVVLPSSALPEAAPPRRSAAAEQAQAEALARGTLIHRLLQSLPDIDPPRREIVAHGYLARAGAQLSADERSVIAARVLAILDDPRFAALFSPGSRAEVPIVGRLARAGGGDLHVSGQIDRLAVTVEEVLIADYKTNRDPPASVEKAPSTYVGQLALYRALLGRIYRDRPIRTALVWTEIPGLMELPPAMLDEAAARITAGEAT